jgi:RNA polymerase sigma-70 factor, ECF subfamily
MTVEKIPVELDNEIALARLVQSGSPESFEILVNRYERQVYRLVRAVTKNAEDAEDVLQETFLKAYANLHGFGGESRFYTWLVRIAMSETLSKLSLRPVPARDWSDGPADTGDIVSSPGNIKGWRPDPEESCSETELFKILAKALEDLETPLRAVFALRDIEGFSSEETASMLGLPLAAVTARLTRARLTLRQNLSVWFENPSDPAAAQSEDESVRHFPGAALAEDRECT